MNPLRRLLSALTPEADAQVVRAKAVGDSLKALRADVQALRKETAAVAARAEVVTREMAQVRRLEIGDRTPAALDALAMVLAEERVVVHLREAVERAAAPGSEELVLEQLWPGDVLDALSRAVPDAVFFEGRESGAQTLRVPPRLAPVESIAVWALINRIVHDVMLPAVAARLGMTGAIDLGPGRLVRRPAGSSAPAVSLKPSHTSVIVFDLVQPRAIVMPAAAYDPPAPASGVRCDYEQWFGSKPA